MRQCWRTLVGCDLKTMPNIDLAKLDAMLKGINLALQWQGKMLHMKTGNPDQESAIAYQGSR